LRVLASDPEDQFDAPSHHLVGDEKEDRCDEGEDQNHDRRDQGLAPRGPRHLGRFRPHLLEKGEWIGGLGRHLPLIFLSGPGARPSRSLSIYLEQSCRRICVRQLDLGTSQRIKENALSMQFGRVKPLSGSTHRVFVRL
jgi:hypothetical protein